MSVLLYAEGGEASLPLVEVHWHGTAAKLCVEELGNRCRGFPGQDGCNGRRKHGAGQAEDVEREHRVGEHRELGRRWSVRDVRKVGTARRVRLARKFALTFVAYQRVSRVRL